MSHVEIPPPAFPEKRRKIATAKLKLYVGGLVAFLATVFILGEAVGWSVAYLRNVLGWKIDDKFVLGSLFITIVIISPPLYWWSLKYWRSIDEMARRAHLDAFFWGGPASWLLIIPLALPPLMLKGFQLDMVENFTSSPSAGFGLGVMVTLVVTLLGYITVWLFWWATKR
jgi:hypothetical protein